MKKGRIEHKPSPIEITKEFFEALAKVKNAYLVGKIRFGSVEGGSE
jgi:hypothetical protein